MVLDLEGNILTAHSTRNISRYAQKNLVGENISIIYTDEERRKGIPGEELAKVSETSDFTDEVQRLREDGTEYTADVIIKPVHTPEGRLIGYVYLIRKAGKQKEDREQEISHEIKNALVNAQGFLDMADQKNEDIKNAEESIQKALNIIDHIKESEPEKQDLSLKEVFKDAYSYAAEKDTVYQVEDMRIKADRTGLMRMFANLITNSVKHNSHPIHIEIGPLENGFYYQDNGKGIMEEDTERIFIEGFSSSEEGKGMGLTLIKDIVDEHGWKIRLKEPETEGARFEIYTE